MNDNESISSHNFDVLACPNGPSGRKKWGDKDNGDTVLEPTLAPEGGNIAGSEGAIYM